MLSDVRSKQLLTVPSFLGTTTIPAQQGVGTSTLKMAPNDSMQAHSFFTFLLSSSGTFLGVWSFSEALGAVVAFLLALVADGFLSRAGTM